MLRKRTQTQSSIEELLRSICTIDGTTPVSLDKLSATTQSGWLNCNTIDQMAHVNQGENQNSYWVELCGDILTFAASKHNRRKVRDLDNPKQIAFCAIVEPPPPSACTSPELRSIAEKLLANKCLAIYTTDGHGYWLGFGEVPGDFTRWQQVRSGGETEPPTRTNFWACLPSRCSGDFG